MTIRFWCPGIPAPGGSKKAFAHPKTGRIVVMDDAKNNRGWKERVAVFASGAMAGKPPLSGPLRLTMAFSMPRPKHHFHTGKKAGILKENAPYFHTAPPDATKLVRSTEDALTGIVWYDDKSVSQQAITKAYEDGRGPGVMVEVEQLEG